MTKLGGKNLNKNDLNKVAGGYSNDYNNILNPFMTEISRIMNDNDLTDSKKAVSIGILAEIFKLRAFDRLSECHPDYKEEYSSLIKTIDNTTNAYIEKLNIK